MSVLESYTTENPFGKSDECAKFTIDDISIPFTLHDITVPDRQYTLGLWMKSNVEGGLVVHNIMLDSDAEWTRHTMTFNAGEIDLDLFFATPGTYYIYHPKLELGNKATDWTEAPEDTNKKIDDTQSAVDDAAGRVAVTEAAIKVLEDCIIQLVTDENGNTLLTQTSSGWAFDLSGMAENLDKNKENLNKLLETVNTLSNGLGGLGGIVENLEETSEYVWITTYEDEPCLALGESDTNNGLFITNTRIIFIKDSGDPTYIDKDGLYSNKVEVGDELRQKGFSWSVRANGNYGLSWKLIEAVSIEAFFGGIWATVGTPLANLKNVAVRVNRSDGAMRRGFGYTLSGQVAEGTNTITVTYEGLTATFTVLGVPEGIELGKPTVVTLGSWIDGEGSSDDITISYSDKVQLANSEISLVSPVTVNASDTFMMMLVGKYVKTMDGTIYYIDSKAGFSIGLDRDMTTWKMVNSYRMSIGYPVTIL